MTRPKRAPSTTDRLRNDILNGDLAAGARLIELQLTDRYGVGRATIRSAIVELGKEGLVTRETNRGATVRAFSVEEAIQVYEARAALEGLMARHAAERATHEERAALRRLVPRMEAAVEAQQTSLFAELGRDLHTETCRIGRQRVAQSLIQALRNQSRHHPDRLASISGRARQSLSEHVSIIESIATGEPQKAQRAVENHIASIIAALRLEVDA